MCFDSLRERAVLFGGWGEGSYHGDTWEWDGSTWELVATTGPSPRAGHVMAFDEAHGVAVLFGGEDGSGELGDTWTWDGVEWTLAATSGPEARYDGAMAYDGFRGRVVLFGGRIGSAFAPGDTWEWDGSSWAIMADTGPSQRWQHAMAYDALARRVALFGGRSNAGDENDLWSWTGSAWEQQAQDAPPPARWGHALDFDELGRDLVLYGGACGASGDCPLFEDTWTHARTGWSEEAGSGPPPRVSHAMVYDAARRQFVLFGGGDAAGVRLGDTWIWEPRRADRVYAFGYNYLWQLGIGDTGSTQVPTPVVGLSGVRDVRSAYHGSIGLRADGTVWLWGWYGAEFADHVPVHFAGLSDVVDIGTGREYQLALLADGQPVAMGANSVGELGDGTLVHRFLDPQPMLNVSEALDVDSTSHTSFVLAQDGRVWACGANGSSGGLGRGFFDPNEWCCQYPYLQPVLNLDSVESLSSGSGHCAVVRADGTVWSWGNGYNGQLGNGSTSPSSVPVQALGIDDAVAIASGQGHVLALRATGEVWAWGLNSCGQLGNGTFTPQGFNTPAPVPGLDDVVAIAAGFQHSLALRRDGSVWAWGHNVYGQLGYDTVGDCSGNATQVPGLSRAVFVSAGDYATFVGVADRSPLLTEQPQSQRLCAPGDVEFSVTVYGGDQTFAWFKDAVPLADGPTGTGSSVSGSATDHLTVSNASTEDAGDYTCLVSNYCGEVVSEVAHLSVCLADFNCDEKLDFFDVLGFLQAFSAGEPSADFTGDGTFDFFDVQEFLGLFSAGCP